MQDSVAPQTEQFKKPVTKSASYVNLPLNTPRILELDINRMMISQNQISLVLLFFY